MNNKCDWCGKEAELYYNERTGLALCSNCDMIENERKARLVAIMPDAEALILYCARVSSDQTRTDTGLINYLIENEHWSPFEMAFAVIEFTTSRALSPQFIRHRSFAFQEFSQRYASPEGVEPASPRRQAARNRQSSIDDLPEDVKDFWDKASAGLYDEAFALYEQGREMGIAREVARDVLPLATRTVFYQAGTIRSWIHYLAVRTDEHAQLEHQILAKQAREILKKELPVIGEALGW